MKKGIIVLVLLFVVSCVKKNSDQVTQAQIGKEQSIQVITKKDIANLRFREYVLDSRAEKQIQSWQKYQELQTIVNNLKTANFSFFDDFQTVQTFSNELQSSAPQLISTPLITSRITAIQTTLLQLQDLHTLKNIPKNDILNSVKMFLQAVSNLNLQLNKKVEKEAQKIEKP